MEHNLLAQLIALNTVSGTEDVAAIQGTAQAARFFSDFLVAQGLTVLEIPCTTGQKSILGLAPQLLSAPGADLGLLLSGHYDVVPFNPSDWHSDALTLTPREGRYYGRGTSDMKGFLSCMLGLAQENLAAARLSYLFTCEEETSMAGAQSVAALLSAPVLTPELCAGLTLRTKEDTTQDPQAIAEQLAPLAGRKFALTVIGEPTEMQPVLGHKGWIARDLIITGEEGHGSRSPIIYSAMHSLPLVLKHLDKLQSKLQRFVDERFEIAASTLSIGTIKGGQSYNTICAEITLGLEVRPTPKLSLAKLNELLTQTLAAINADLPPQYPAQLRAPYPDTAAFPEGPGAGNDHARYQDYLQLLSPKLQAKYQDVLNSSYVAYCTEASWLQVITHECIIMGPGSIADAHQANEGIDLSELSECAATLQRLAGKFA